MQFQLAQLLSYPCFALGPSQPRPLGTFCMLELCLQLRNLVTNPARLLGSALSCFQVFPQNLPAAQAA